VKKLKCKIILLITYFFSSILLYSYAYDLKQKAIIIGASSGIGAALAKELNQRNYTVGITGRREALLKSVIQELTPDCHYLVHDVSKPDQARKKLLELIEKLNSVDLVVINAGTGSTDFTWDIQEQTILTNVLGFSALATATLDYFIEQGYGHLVGISSIAGLIGMPDAPIYSASKTYASTFLQGLRARTNKAHSNIIITDIKPGFVDTAMGQASDFWRCSPETAALQIADAIEAKKDVAYVTKRWIIIAWLLKLLPDWFIYCFL
jgi:short-subunit dehydrogenase